MEDEIEFKERQARERVEREVQATDLKKQKRALGTEFHAAAQQRAAIRDKVQLARTTHAQDDLVLRLAELEVADARVAEIESAIDALDQQLSQLIANVQFGKYFRAMGAVQ
jgi:predicted  nucleic acid-binding Zn-ribbon protein